MNPNLLVVGAQPDSLGDWIAAEGRDAGYQVHMAGISGESIHLDITNSGDCERVIAERDYHSIVCTAGINQHSPYVFHHDVEEHMKVNATGPIVLLEYWLKKWKETERTSPMAPLHFVGISSNSAHVARSMSAVYCMSKAALSMGLRCIARREAAHWREFNIYGYEPGWIDGTPMSEEVEERLMSDRGVIARHRIPGDRVVEPGVLAEMIVMNLRWLRSPLNGTMIRVDGGEQ